MTQSTPTTITVIEVVVENQEKSSSKLPLKRKERKSNVYRFLSLACSHSVRVEMRQKRAEEANPRLP